MPLAFKRSFYPPLSTYFRGCMPRFGRYASACVSREKLLLGRKKIGSKIERGHRETLAGCYSIEAKVTRVAYQRNRRFFFFFIALIDAARYPRVHITVRVWNSGCLQRYFFAKERFEREEKFGGVGKRIKVECTRRACSLKFIGAKLTPRSTCWKVISL